MPITYFGSTSNPADAGLSNAATLAITPVPSMVAGDLCLLVAVYQTSTSTPVISNDGGQVWTALPKVQSTSTIVGARLFWCRFNGTWSANPSVTGLTTPNDLVMHVFRPSSGANTWAVDVAQVEAKYAAPLSPFTVTITGQTTLSASTVTLAGWISDDDNTWGNLAGGGWVVAGNAQYRVSTARGSTYAYKIQSSAGATGNVSKNQLTLGGDPGTSLIVTFAEVAPVGPTIHQGAATLAGVGGLTAGGARKRAGAATFAGVGAFAAESTFRLGGRAQLAGVATLTAAGVRIGAIAVEVFAGSNDPPQQPAPVLPAEVSAGVLPEATTATVLVDAISVEVL